MNVLKSSERSPEPTLNQVSRFNYAVDFVNRISLDRSCIVPDWTSVLQQTQVKLRAETGMGGYPWMQPGAAFTAKSYFLHMRISLFVERWGLGEANHGRYDHKRRRAI
ncbi:predicted protein [Histoplasma mississippiense (nom. inval.)]|uniref:predicted protein n=1 Tax=Ajellomyces capsulatus (strain NAm1 / WU24) TaxID=2059318 RepID=UPI000157C176|nr:predicted protein [Histoplasma mississippiense (nom. inval.)]EDN07786.1 predicted protein [Histoplasma mississippiense (nom. inval.)]